MSLEAAYISGQNVFANMEMCLLYECLLFAVLLTPAVYCMVQEEFFCTDQSFRGRTVVCS